MKPPSESLGSSWVQSGSEHPVMMKGSSKKVATVQVPKTVVLPLLSCFLHPFPEISTSTLNFLILHDHTLYLHGIISCSAINCVCMEVSG